MSNEIATYSMILNKLSLGTSGNECPTKTLILAISSLITITNASTYGANECVRIDDINKSDSITSYGEWVVTVSANPTSLPSDGGTSTITASAKRTVYWASGKTTEETATPTLSTDLGSISNNILTLSENTSTSSKTATITATHGGVSATCTVKQEGEEETFTFVFIINPQEYKISSDGGSFKGGDTGYDVLIDSHYEDVNGNYGAAVDYDPCYENGELPTVLTEVIPDWITYKHNDTAVGDDFIISANTTGSPRTATIWFKQHTSGKMQHLTITQSGVGEYRLYYDKTEDDNCAGNLYLIDFKNIYPAGEKTYGNVRIYSFFEAETVPTEQSQWQGHENNYYVNFSVTSHPDWLRVIADNNSKNHYDEYNWYYWGKIIVIPENLSGNDGDIREGEITLTQDGTDQTMSFTVEQNLDKGTNLDSLYNSANYTFTWNDDSTTDKDLNIPLSGTSNYLVEVKSKFLDVSDTSTVAKNKNWTILSTVDWIDATNNGNLVINVAANDSNAIREGAIVLMQEMSNKSLQINITQLAD